MAFTLEDGTGVVGANALCSVTFFRDYHTDRGRTGVDVGTIADAVVQSLIIRATDYLVKRFGESLKGQRSTETQELPFPRKNITIDGRDFASDAVPLGIQQAIAEYALRANDVLQLAPDAPLAFDTQDASGETVAGSGVVVEKEERADVLLERTRYADPSTASNRSSGSSLVDGWMIPAYPGADLLVDPFLRGEGVIRA